MAPVSQELEPPTNPGRFSRCLRHRDRNRQVVAWAGICEGWAAAAILHNRPTNVVNTVAFDGKPITFYPSDIKALASQLWATGIGEDGTALGGLKRWTRRSTNPGSWHLAVVNQIGAYQSFLVMDKDNDLAIWNQPIIGYRFSYFNPQTGEVSDPEFELNSQVSLAKAIVPIAKFTKDPFKKSRSKQAHNVLGIGMEVWYIDETKPSHAVTDGPSNDKVESVTYLYDLELDGSGEIIGGSWYKDKNNQPDFLWMFPKGTRVLTEADRLLFEDWTDRKMAVPQSWCTSAREASETGTPLARVVEGLLNFANGR